MISESAHVAFAWVKAHAYELGISHARDEDVFKRLDVHLHLPAGAVKKDGPSAGVAMVVALVSLSALASSSLVNCADLPNLPFFLRLAP